MRQRKTIVLNGIRYYSDRPSDCRYCYFWKSRRTGCTLGEENCYYLAGPVRKKKSPCKGCSYGPCVSWCVKKVLGRKEVPANA